MLSALWCGQMIIMGLSLREAVSTPPPPGSVGCLAKPQGKLGADFWLSCLVMDSIITTLTVYKTTKYMKLNGKRDRLVQVILRDGLLYFVAILSANLCNCLTYYLAPAILRVIAAGFCQCITSKLFPGACGELFLTAVGVMVSRLQLNLRSESITPPEIPISQDPGASSFATETKLREKQPTFSNTSTTLSSIANFFQSTITELGRDVEMIEEGENGEAVGVNSDIEMGPIQPTSKSIAPTVPTLSSFSRKEPERLEDWNNVTPAIARNSGGGWVDL
ncbi:hypothetical protein FRC12_020867 [Ceratobasidium sp. 428]|nr:hypothetical protein FRC12_020867 [Ceratobasidium sp. 428]